MAQAPQQQDLEAEDKAKSMAEAQASKTIGLHTAVSVLHMCARARNALFARLYFSTDISEAQLCEDLHDLASQWRQLGVQLEVPQATLNKIQGGKNICPECLECIIHEWLTSDGEHTKTRLVEVLGMKALGEGNLANRISDDTGLAKYQG